MFIKVLLKLFNVQNEYICWRTRKGGVNLDGEIGLIRKIQRTGNKTAADILIREYYDEIYVYVFR